MTHHVKERRRKRRKTVPELPEPPAAVTTATPSLESEWGAHRPGENVGGEGGVPAKNKKRKKRDGEGEETPVTMETSETEPRMKKKKHRPVEEEVSTVTADQNNTEEEEETRLEVPASQESKKKKKKKKKRRKERREEQEAGGEEIQNPSHEAVTQGNFFLEPGDLDELEKYVPDVRSRVCRSRYDVELMLRYDLHRLREFAMKGVAVRWGRFTAKENQQLARNVDDFLALTGISSATMLFFPERFGEEAANVKALRAKHRFYERLADGIPRMCHNVYKRAKKAYNKLSYMGRFTENELKDLKKLHTRYGNNWKMIAKKMERSVHALQMRFAHISTGQGPWDSDEVSRLLKAVRAHVEGLVTGAAGAGSHGDEGGPWVSRKQLCRNLPWKQISCQVQTRCWSQCRGKWLIILKKKIAPRGRPAFSGGARSFQARIDLINTLYNMNVDDAVDIDWEHVANVVGNVTVSYVQTTFCRLKITRVPHWANRSYCEIIDFLWEKIIPELKQKLLEAKGRKVQEEQQQEENRKHYLLTDIFSQEEHGFREIDNAQVDVCQLDETALD